MALTHGVLSSYSQDQIHNLKPTITPAINDEVDYDSLPFSRHIEPSVVKSHKPTFIEDDPLLGVTPEKVCSSKSRLSNGDHNVTMVKDSNNIIGNGRSRRDLKVTFDQNVDVRHLSPDPKSVVGVSVDIADDDDHIVDVYGVVKEVEDVLLDPEQSLSHSSFGEDNKLYNYHAYSDKSTYSSLCDRETHSLLHSQNSGKQNNLRNSTTQHPTGGGVPKTNILARTQSADIEEENTLARPEFNSTLKMSSELQQVKGDELDMKEAITSKLKASIKTCSNITDKV